MLLGWAVLTVSCGVLQGLLQIPALASGRTEATLAEEHVSEDGMVVDPDFLPAPQSL